MHDTAEVCSNKQGDGKDGLVDCRRWRLQPYAAASSTTATAPAMATRAGSRIDLQKANLSAPYPSSNNLGISFTCCTVHVVNAHPQIGAICRVSKPPTSKPTNILFPGLSPLSPFLHSPRIPYLSRLRPSSKWPRRRRVPLWASPMPPMPPRLCHRRHPRCRRHRRLCRRPVPPRPRQVSRPQGRQQRGSGPSSNSRRAIPRPSSSAVTSALLSCPCP